jgi:hypothetical protein
MPAHAAVVTEPTRKLDGVHSLISELRQIAVEGATDAV